ncbi:hypothetical protein SK128_013914, partial [Halocaridina rubra]
MFAEKACTEVTLTFIYILERKKLPFRLEDMTLPKNLHPSLLMSEFKHQATFHFWTFQVDGTPISLPALLLTDT